MLPATMFFANRLAGYERKLTPQTSPVCYVSGQLNHTTLRDAVFVGEVKRRKLYIPNMQCIG